jgi:hypothetical protein
MCGSHDAQPPHVPKQAEGDIQTEDDEAKHSDTMPSIGDRTADDALPRQRKRSLRSQLVSRSKIAPTKSSKLRKMVRKWISVS